MTRPTNIKTVNITSILLFLSRNLSNPILSNLDEVAMGAILLQIITNKGVNREEAKAASIVRYVIIQLVLINYPYYQFQKWPITIKDFICKVRKKQTLRLKRYFIADKSELDEAACLSV